MLTSLIDVVDNAWRRMLISGLMDASLYSLRMRASLNRQHISGAERIVSTADIGTATAELVTRAMQSPQGMPDDVQCRAERLDPAAIEYRRLPDLTTWQVQSWQAGRNVALELLVRAGVSSGAASEAIRLLASGPAPGGQVMRGALILDAASGARLEHDPARGVRASRMDLAPEARTAITTELARAGLGHHRVREALVLAGKVLGAPGLLAELCWSDDPGYVTGYVADPRHGYQRITQLKPTADPHGGRAFFVDRAAFDLEALTHYLERQVVLFHEPGAIHAPSDWGE